MTIVLVILGLIFLFAIALYNTLIARKNEVKNSFATIDTMLKKRFDLIPNIVASVKESMKFETSTLEKVIQLRSSLGQGNISAQQLQKIDQESSSALRNVMVQVEAYPDLKSSQNMVQLQNSLQEVEDQLAAARRAYNAAVTNYNNSLEMFPTSLVAGMMGLSQESLFAVAENEKKNINIAEAFKS